MSRKCDKCGKGPVTGNNISHSHRKTHRLFYPNLHNVTLTENGTKIKKRLCTRCLKTLSKIK